MKNIIKFILKMVVTVCLVVGVIYVAMWLTGKDKNQTQIINASYEYNIEQKIPDSFANLSTIVSENNQKSFSGQKPSQNVVDSTIKVNLLLKEYYSHYIPLTSFENQADQNTKQAIIKKLELLNEKIGNTTVALNNVNSWAGTDYSQKNIRIVNMFNDLCEQTGVLFDVCDLLKDYVYKVNYQTEICTNKAEATLETAKNYAKIVFDAELNGNIYLTKTTANISDATELGFNRVMTKALNMSGEKGTAIEYNFVINYSKIDKKFIKGYFSLKPAYRAEYLSNLNNFLDEFTEDEAKNEEITNNAKLQQKYLTYLNAYLSQSEF